MTRRVAVIGDKTTTNGTIITGSGTSFCGSDSLALLGDKVSCPACKQIGVIVQAAHHFIIDGVPTAYDGCRVACGCPNNRIIATKSSMFLDTEEDSNSGSNFTDNQIKNISSTTPWLGFRFPNVGDFSGMKCKVKLDDGSVVTGVFDKNNEINFKSVTAGSRCLSLTIDAIDIKNESQNLSSIILKKLEG